ncbi:MAG: alpha/beta fold hydrolase [Paracoccaceae bacterium]
MIDPLVLLPGMMCDARLFALQINDLSRDHAVMVAPITQGERVEEIASALLPLLPAKFALAGLSMGGIVAMELLRRAPERITRIALMDTNPLAETPQTAAAYEPMIIGARAGRLDEVMRGFMRPDFLAPGPGRISVLNKVFEMAQDLGPEILVRQVRALQRRRDQQPTLRRCKVPALVMCGAHDALTPLKRHAFMAELIPYARLEVIEDAGHLPTLEAPEAVTAVLRAWLKQPFVLQ